MATNIEWCDETWNPIIARVRPDAAQIAQAKGYASLVQIAEKQAGKRGHHCEHAHRGCENCYAEAMNGRCLPSWGTGLPYDRRSRDLLNFEIHEETLVQPLKWNKPRSIFPCSMTDLFGEWVPDEFIAGVVAVMRICSWHRFIVLSKRHRRMATLLASEEFQDLVESAMWTILDEIVDPLNRRSDDARATASDEWPLPNVILGTSASDQATFDAAAPDMRALAAAGWHTVWSLEPLLGPVDIRSALPRRVPLDQIPGSALNDGCTEMYERGASWVIVGSESGHGARPMNEDWVRGIRDQCVAAGVPFFYKQKTVEGKKIGTPDLDGRMWMEIPQ